MVFLVFEFRWTLTRSTGPSQLLHQLKNDPAVPGELTKEQCMSVSQSVSRVSGARILWSCHFLLAIEGKLHGSEPKSPLEAISGSRSCIGVGLILSGWKLGPARQMCMWVLTNSPAPLNCSVTTN